MPRNACAQGPFPLFPPAAKPPPLPPNPHPTDTDNDIYTDTDADTDSNADADASPSRFSDSPHLLAPTFLALGLISSSGTGWMKISLGCPGP